MIRDIVKDKEILSQVSEDFDYATDSALVTDLLDTAMAHKITGKCVGLAAVQIGVPKRLICVRTSSGSFMPIFNPKIIRRIGTPYTAIETCLSVDGAKQVRRFPQILFSYSTATGKKIVTKLSGTFAQIVQHEVDHCDGVLI